jgi:hypothetical protein
MYNQRLVIDLATQLHELQKREEYQRAFRRAVIARQVSNDAASAAFPQSAGIRRKITPPLKLTREAF